MSKQNPNQPAKENPKPELQSKLQKCGVSQNFVHETYGVLIDNRVEDLDRIFLDPDQWHDIERKLTRMLLAMSGLMAMRRAEAK